MTRFKIKVIYKPVLLVTSSLLQQLVCKGCFRQTAGHKARDHLTILVIYSKPDPVL